MTWYDHRLRGADPDGTGSRLHLDRHHGQPLPPATLASGTLVATGRVTKPGRPIALAAAEVTDATGRLVATAASNCLILLPGRGGSGQPCV